MCMSRRRMALSRWSAPVWACKAAADERGPPVPAHRRFLRLARDGPARSEPSASCCRAPAATAPWVSRPSRSAGDSRSRRAGRAAAPQYAEMPAGAIATGAVDLVVPVEEMPGPPDAPEAGTPRRVISPGVARRPIGSRAARDLRDPARPARARFQRLSAARHFCAACSGACRSVNAPTLEEYMATLECRSGEARCCSAICSSASRAFFATRRLSSYWRDQVIPRLFEGKMADGERARLGAGMRDGRGSLFARDAAARAHGLADRGDPGCRCSPPTSTICDRHRRHGQRRQTADRSPGSRL